MGRLLLAALLIAVPGAGLAQTVPAAAPAAAGAPSPAELTALIDGHFRRFQDQQRVPGMVWGIVRDGRLVHIAASGVQDFDARRPVSAESRAHASARVRMSIDR